MALEILVLLLLVLANGVFAIAEFAVISARKPRLQERAEQGEKGARTALEMANQPSRFLSTVQIGITLVGTLAGTFGGATIARKLTVWINNVAFLAPYSEAISVALVVLPITYLTLVLGELVPKRLAMADPERVAVLMARPMRLLSRITAPAVRLLSASTELVLRLLGVQPSSEPSVTEEEVKIMLEHGTRVGVFEPIEEEMVGRVFRLGDRSVSTLITPRPQVTWLDVEDSQEQIEQKIMNSPYGHFPVAKGDLDNLLGVVHIKDLLAHVMEGKRIHLRELATDPLFVPEGMRAFDMLERFRETRSQIALVVDEYGSLEGLITLMDILEALVGDIPEPHEPEEADVIERDDGSWLVDGKVPLDELQFLVDIDTWPMEGDQFYQTLGGFVMTQLGRIPTSSDHFEWQRFRFEVVDMDGRRVDKVLIRQLSEPTETPVTDQEDAD